MTYFCFIESDLLSVPHMEPLAAEDIEAAREEASDLLAQHASGYAAHVFEGDQRRLSLRRPGASASARAASSSSAQD